MSARSVPGRHTDGVRRTPARYAVPVLLGLFFLCVYLVSGSSDLRHNGDTDLRYQTTQAIVDYGRLWIAHPWWVDTRVAAGQGGHLYAFYAPGQTLLMVPLYIAGKAVAHHLSLPYDITTLYSTRSLDLFLGAALAVLFFFLALALGYTTRVAALLTLIFGLASVAWPDAQSALEQTQVNLFLLLAVFGVLTFVRGGLADRRWLLVAGSGAGLAAFTRYDALLYVMLVIGYPAVLRWRHRAWRALLEDILGYGLAVAPWLVGIGAWDYLRFGSPFLTGLHESTFGEPIWSGFLGLTVSPGKGLLWYLPVLFLLPWALPRFYRRYPSFTVFCAALVLVTVLFYSNVLYWHGDPSWGPRYLYVVVPYLVLPLGEILAAWRRTHTALRAATVLLIACSLALQVSAVSVTQWRFWYRLQAAEEQTSQKFQWGASHYHYYWTVADSPIPMQIDDVYQVARLNLGDQKYRLTRKPGSLVHSNPAQDYPVNTVAFWWADTRHPLLGPRTRAAIAAGLGMLATGCLVLLLLTLTGRASGSRERLPGDFELEPA